MYDFEIIILENGSPFCTPLAYGPAMMVWVNFLHVSGSWGLGDGGGWGGGGGVLGRGGGETNGLF